MIEPVVPVLQGKCGFLFFKGLRRNFLQQPFGAFVGGAGFIEFAKRGVGVDDLHVAGERGGIFLITKGCDRIELDGFLVAAQVVEAIRSIKVGEALNKAHRIPSWQETAGRTQSPDRKDRAPCSSARCCAAAASAGSTAATCDAAVVGEGPEGCVVAPDGWDSRAALLR